MAGIETPKYEVVEQRDGYEIREYAPHIVAEVTVSGDFKESMNGGFRKLADYIFGNNTKASGGDSSSEKIAMTAPVIEQKAASEKIAMTAPVIEQENQQEQRVVSFVMPSQYTLATLPKPNNDEVTLREVPKKKFAAISFSGSMNAEKSVEMKGKLRDLLKRDKLDTVGEPMLAQYNPPWTPPFMRKNEVLLEIAGPSQVTP